MIRPTRRGLVRPARALAAATLLALSGALALPAAAQTTDPVWSAIMTVGTTQYGGRGYDVAEDEGGSLSDNDFEYNSTAYTVELVELDDSYAVSFHVDKDGLPEADILTLEIDGLAFPFEDTSDAGEAYWEWAVPEDLSNSDLPIGDRVVVCLRTAAQVCPTSAPSALSVADVSAEEGEDLTFTVALSPPSTETVTVAWATSGGTATSGTDFTAGTGTLTFTAGDTEQTVTVSTTEDMTEEDHETFTVTLSNATAATISGATATGVIWNDDGTSATDPVWSTVMTVARTMFLGHGYADPDYFGDAGTFGSLSDNDFDHLSATYEVYHVEVHPGEGVSFGVDPAGLPEDHTLTLEIDGHAFPFEDRRDASSASYWVWDVPEDLIDITNDLPIGDRVVVCLRSGAQVCPTTVPPSLSVADVSAEEGEDLTFTVALSPPSTETVTVDWATSGGTATSGTDFTAGTGKLTFAAGDTEKTFTVLTTDDSTEEDDETFTVTLSSPTNATISGATATGTIENNDVTPTTDPVWSTTLTAGDTQGGHGYDRTDLDAPTIGALDDDDFDYGSSPATTYSYGVLALDVATNVVRFVVAESGLPTNEILTLELGGHALAFSDRHNAISGQSQWYWTVPAALDDLETEFPVGSTATVCLRTATQVCPTGSIVTPPTLPTLSIADAEATEGGDVTFTATLSATATADVMATWTASIESDDTAVLADLGTTTTGPVMVTAGQPTGTFMVPTAPDATNEGNETFTVTLSSVSSNAQLAADATATGTIVNDDQPTVGFKEERVTVLEGAAIISFLVELDEASTVPITVDWETRAGSAEADVDYTAASGTLRFAAGDTEETITVALIDDAIHEENVEEFTVHLSGTDDALVTLGRSSVLGRIIDRDRATITVAEETTVDEDAGTVTLTLTASASASAAYMIDYATENGTAEAGTDYTAASGQVTFPAEETEQTITITVLDDAADEDREDFKVRLSNATAQRIDLPADPARVLIEDNDDPPTVTVADGTATEGDKVEFTVTLSALSGLDVEVDYATTETDPQSAVSGTDFTAASGTLEIEAGNRTGTIEVQTTEDDASESAETFTLTISNPDNATLGAKVAATGTINDDDAAGVRVSATALTVTEQDAAGDSYTVVLDTEPTHEVTVAVGGHAGTDVSLSASTLTFTTSNWDQAQTVTVTALNDDDTANDAVTLTHTATSTDGNYSGIAIAGVSVTVTDNDTTTPAVTLVLSDASIGENGGVSTVTATVSPASAAAFTVTVAAAAVAPAVATDFELSTNRVLSFAENATTSTGTVTITGVDNDVDAADKTVTVSGTVSATSVTAPANRTLTLEDDDPLTVGISNSRGDEHYVPGVAGVAIGPYVQMSAVSDKIVIVTWTASIESGDTAEEADFVDLSAVTGTVWLVPGWKVHAFNLPPVVFDDALDEEDETFTVTLSAVNAVVGQVNASVHSAGTMTIVDDDPTPTVTVADAAATEGNKVKFVVTLSAVSGRDVTVDYATSVATGDDATSGTDFTSTGGTLTIAAADNTATGTIEVQTTEDDASESAETFTLTISNPDNATLGAKVAATGTINDDDANAAPTFSSSSTFDAAENQTAAGTVLATDGDTGDDITGYAITGGADQSFFSIGVTSGALTFDAAPNFEDAQDSDTGNDYVVEVQATSGAGEREKTATQTITVTVTDVSGEAPGKPNAPDVSAASVTSLTVSWSAPANAGPAIDDYDVQYREGTSGSWSDGNHTGTATTATLSSLSENTSYQVQVRAKNAEGTGAWSDSGSGTTDANAAPTFSSSATFSAAENQTTAGTVLATDGDTGDDITGYAITGGADQSFFSIGVTSGALTFDAAPNFEDAQDSDTGNDYVVEVQATSGAGEREKTATQTITVTVTDVSGEAPGKPNAPDVSAASVTSLTVSWSAPANAGPAIDDYDVQYREGTSGSWSDGNHTGAATTATLSSLSENTSYQVQVRATNDEGTGDWSDSGSGTTDANAAPTFSSSATFSAAENQTTAGTVLATDGDTGDDITGYAITGGADQSFFSIGVTSGALTFDAAPNFEDAQDSDTGNDYVVEVQATSGAGEREKTATQTITVTVTDVSGEAPGKPNAPDVSAASVTSLTVSWSAPANAGPAIDDYDVQYREGTSGSWSDGNHTGAATTATLSSLSENTSYQVQVRATNDEGTGDWSDSGSGTTDANAAPTFSSSATFSAAENQTTAGTVLATDGDTGDDITGYAITGGADQSFFSIGVTSGALTFDAAPNFEDAQDQGTNNTYVVEVQATSGTGTREKTATQTITVTVTDVAGEAPGKPAAPTVSAASVSSLTVNWSAPDNGGPAIDDYDVRYRAGTTGDWSDGNHTGTATTATLSGLSENTSYQVQVRATNDEGTGSWSDSGTGTTDANAAPTFSSSSTFDAAENQTAAGTVLATDGDTDDDVTGYEITGGADQSFFSIGATSGALTFDAAPNFEDAQDQGTNNTYVVTVEATSGTGTREKTATQTITVTVTDEDEAPGKPDAPDVAAASVSSLTVSWSAPANAGPAIDDYDVQYRAGTSGSWSDGGHTGTATTATLSSLSENTSYQVQVRATNDEGTGSWSDSGTGTTDANAAPTFSSSSTFDAAENQTAAGTVLATDGDTDDDVTGYEITGGADQSFFSIGATSGALTFDDAPNFEDAEDQGTDNTYVVTVQATSGTGTREKTATQTITVTVTDVAGEAPGKPAAPTVSAASVSSLTVNWSAPDNGGPAIDDYDVRYRAGTTGDWSDGNHTGTATTATLSGLSENTSYQVQVRATNDEGTGSWSDSGTGTTDANAAPTFSSSSTFDAAENQTAAGTVLATDGDTDDDVTGYEITGGADQSFFSIGATSGALTFDDAPNFEDAEDQGTDNTYVVTVQATSGTGTREKTATQTITVTVTDVAGEAPGKPAAPTVSAASVSSLTVNWSAPDNGGPAIDDYDVRYRAGTTGDWSDGNHTGTATTATLSGLSENTSYQVQVRATNDEGTGSWSDSGTGTTDANAAPTFSSSSTFDAAENQTAAGTVLATDGDTDDDVTGYEITGGADQAFFSIASTSGALTFDDAPNFEDAQDQGTNNTYVVEVQATSGTGTREKTATQTITVTVTDVAGEAPGKPAAPDVAAASVSSLTVSWSAPANAGPAITDYDVQYRAGTSGDWSDGNHTGTATTATLSGLSENTSYQVQVRATNDEGTGSWSDSGTGTTDANAAPTFSSSSTFDAAENQTAAGTVLATDGDTDDDVTGYEITGGADQSFFSIGATSGALTFDDAPNFEDAEDQGTDNTYVVTVQATSGTGTREKTATQTITVTVTDVAGEAPGKPAAPTVSAASVSSLTVNWSAPDNGGPAIDDYDVRYRAGTTGDWSDGNHTGTATTATLSGLSENTSYQVQVRATNDEGTGSWSDSGTGTTDANAAPTFSSSSTFDAAENQTAAGTVLATDGDTDDDVTGYEITGGADQAFFSIASTSGALTFDDAPNFEDAQDQGTNNTYVVEVQATSGTGTREKTATQTITVTVTDVAGEAPGKPAAPDVAAASVSSLTVSWSAPANAGPAITDYDVQYRAGTSGDWSDGNHTGTATTATLSGLSENTSYQVQVRATNDEGTGSWSDSGTGTTDANAAPTFSSSSTFDAAENQTAAGTVLATDGDTDDDVTGYEITGGADQAFFSIASTSGALTFDDAPNFEDAQDQGTNNTYVVEVQATSGTGTREKTATQTITVTVTDVAGEAPGKPAAPDVAAASVSSLTVSWSAPANAGPAITDYDVQYRAGTSGDWSDGNHAGTATTATLSSLSENTSYQVQVRATNDEGTGSWSDSGNGRTSSNAAPTFSSSATFDAAENQTAAGTVLATDGDTDDDVTGYEITGGADQSFFSIASRSGELTFDDAPDFEEPQDQGADNTYQVTVQATSGTGTREKTATQTVMVTVTDVDEQPPPREVEAEAASHTSLAVRWEAPETDGGPTVTGYELRYREHPGSDWEDWPHSGTATRALIAGLEVDTAYEIEVRALYGATQSAWVRVPGQLRTNALPSARVRNVRLVSGPGSDGVWNAGERVEVLVRYSLPVVVERPAAPWHDGFGRPREPGPAVALLFNTGPRPGYGYGVSHAVARYAGGSGTDTLAFGYTVTAADAGAGSVVVASSLLLRGAEIRTLEGGEAETYLGRRTVVVVPEVLLDDSGDDVWTAGETILVRIRFTGEVRVSTTGGTPTVGLRFGDAEGLGAAVHAARYTGGSGSDTLTFEYGVSPADGTVRVVGVVADSLALNGGTIRNPRGKDAYLDHLSTVWAAWRQVDVQWPEVGVSSGAAAREGGVLRFTVALKRASILPVRVECATRDGTATAGEDYLARHAVLLFEPGETEKTVAVAVLTDGRAEGEETVLLRLLKAKTTWPDGLAHIVEAEAEAQGTIVDVAGRGPGSRDAGGLTARFEGMPAEHDGESGIRFRVAFSEDIGISFRALREDAFTVSGGRVTGGRRVDGRRDLFQMTVRPESFGAVTITLPAGRECGVSGAICTKGEPRRTLTNTPSATVRGPAMLSVADARAREGEDETIDFAVTLSRAASGPVTVAYATADRTARAGSDYTRTSGKLSFAAGETELTVRVPVLDDAHDEGEETLVLRLTQASGARIADGEAVGTIENADPLPAAWLARFGRTAGGHVLAAVGERLRGGGQTQATVAGQRLQGADAAAVAEAQAAYERAWAQRLQEGRLQERPRALAVRDLVAGSSFSVTAAADGGAAQAAPAEPGGRWTVWGRGGWSHFAGRADGEKLKVDGDVVTAAAGADYEHGAVLAGLALAYSTGSGTYDHASERSGSVESTLLSVHPYARLALHERLAVWGLFGYGLVGHVTLDDAAADAVETATGLLLGAFGVDGLLLAAAQSGGLELAARADGLLLRMSSEAATGLAASEADLSRWRLLLEAGYAGVPLLGGELRPAVAVGGRYDAGAAETGAGLVLSGRLSYALPAWGLTLSAGGEGLLVHEEEGFREWGAGGSLRFDPGAPGRGLALQVEPSWGVAGSGAGRLWALPDAASLAPAAAQPSPGARLAAELSYGLDAPGGAGALTPYAGVALAADGARTWRLGTRLRLDSGLAVSLQGTRAEPVSATAQHTLSVAATLSW